MLGSSIILEELSIVLCPYGPERLMESKTCEQLTYKRPKINVRILTRQEEIEGIP